MIDLTLIIIIALAFASIVLWIVTKLLKKGVEERFQSNPIVPYLDGKHPESSLFMRVNGCGCKMLGDFRHD